MYICEYLAFIQGIEFLCAGYLCIYIQSLFKESIIIVFFSLLYMFSIDLRNQFLLYFNILRNHFLLYFTSVRYLSICLWNGCLLYLTSVVSIYLTFNNILLYYIFNPTTKPIYILKQQTKPICIIKQSTKHIKI